MFSEKVNEPKIVIIKSRRELELWDGGIELFQCPAGLGPCPVGDKQREGDGATPEGEYYVCTRNEKSRFYKSFGISYPSIKDAEAGLLNGHIDKKTYNEIVSSIKNGKRPPWDTPLGGEICIHGNGSKSDWTAGCIAVENDIMDMLFEYCPLGTKILIEP